VQSPRRRRCPPHPHQTELSKRCGRRPLLRSFLLHADPACAPASSCPLHRFLSSQIHPSRVTPISSSFHWLLLAQRITQYSDISCSQTGPPGIEDRQICRRFWLRFRFAPCALSCLDTSDPLQSGYERERKVISLFARTCRNAMHTACRIRCTMELTPAYRQVFAHATRALIQLVSFHPAGSCFASLASYRSIDYGGAL
jgi:hypothetical protein